METVFLFLSYVSGFCIASYLLGIIVNKITEESVFLELIVPRRVAFIANSILIARLLYVYYMNLIPLLVLCVSLAGLIVIYILIIYHSYWATVRNHANLHE